MKKKHILYSVILSMGMAVSSCSDYLNVSDKLNETTQNLDKIFMSKEFSEQWLSQAYAYLIRYNSDIHDRGWCPTNFADDYIYCDNLAELRKFKYAEYDEEFHRDAWYDAYNGIRQASIFIHNIDRNLEFTQEERKDYKAQARFVRAYLYWKLLQKFGPIPLLPDEGMDYSLSYKEIATPRSTYDECADFIAQEMVLAAYDLPEDRDSRNIARPTRGAALAARAKVLLYAASPINNPGGPGDPLPSERFADLVDDQGHLLMGQEYNEEKWAKAAAAAKDVVEMGKRGVYRLYTVKARSEGTIDYPATITPPPHDIYSNKNYPDGWADIDPLQSYQNMFNGNLHPSDNPEMIFTTGQNFNAYWLAQRGMPMEIGGSNCYAMSGKQCDAYEMNDGTPFDKKKEYTGDDMYISTEEEKSGQYAPLRTGVNKRYAHREPRFYASCAYNGTFWPATSAELPENRNKQVFYYRGTESGWGISNNVLRTGIGVMKYISTRDNGKAGTIIAKPVVGIRYADVLLWYAEALNELNPGAQYTIPSWDGKQSYTITRDEEEMHYAIKRVRLRAGLPDYDETDVYQSQEAFRKKLKHERQIEFFAENSRYFDLRRWKDAQEEESMPITGCNIYMSETARDYFHTQVTLSDIPTTFSRKMYFWPISKNELNKNFRMTQNPGWKSYDQ